MKMLYFMNASDGNFNSNTSTAPDAVCYPLSKLEGMVSKDADELDLYFDSAQAAGTDEANDTSGTDKITIEFSTDDAHKAAFKDIVEVINEPNHRNNGFAVIMDAANSIKPSSDIVQAFTILTDNPA